MPHYHVSKTNREKMKTDQKKARKEKQKRIEEIRKHNLEKGRLDNTNLEGHYEEPTGNVKSSGGKEI